MPKAKETIKLLPGEAYVVMGAHQLRAISRLMRALSTYADTYSDDDMHAWREAANHFDDWIDSTENPIGDKHGND